MNKIETEFLERLIAKTIKFGFDRKPSPHEKSFDDGDFLQMGRDVVDAILLNHDIAAHPECPGKKLSEALESASFGLESLSRALNEWAYKR